MEEGAQGNEKINCFEKSQEKLIIITRQRSLIVATAFVTAQKLRSAIRMMANTKM